MDNNNRAKLEQLAATLKTRPGELTLAEIQEAHRLEEEATQAAAEAAAKARRELVRRIRPIVTATITLQARLEDVGKRRTRYVPSAEERTQAVEAALGDFDKDPTQDVERFIENLETRERAARQEYDTEVAKNRAAEAARERDGY
jgi:hypothetical protein